MTIVITSGAIILILALIFLGPLIEIFGPLLLWLGAIGIVIISSIIAIYLLFQGEIVGAAIFSIPFWIAIYWGNKQEEKEPVSENTPLPADAFNQLLLKYKNKVESLVDKPDELEKYVKDFEAKFSIGKKMAHLLGALEWEITWDNNESRAWRFSSIDRDNVSGEKEKEFELSYDGITVKFSEPKSGYDYDHEYRDLDIYDGKKKVANYSCYRYRDAYYDWGEAGDIYMHSFKPNKWLEKLNNLYVEWNSEKLSIEAEEKRKQKEESVKEKYL